MIPAHSLGELYSNLRSRGSRKGLRLIKKIAGKPKFKAYIQAYTRGKMRKAEFSLGQLIDTYALAKDLGVGEDILAEVRKEHDRAHILWEWWTAENSDGFHNPEYARQSLAESMSASQKGIEILNKAISQKTMAK